MLLPLNGVLSPLAGGFGTQKWWLSGGISPTNAIAAYQPKGAASLAASYTNLANPGAYTAAPGNTPGWDATNGWKFAAASLQYLTTGVTPVNGWSIIVRYSNASSRGAVLGAAGTSNTRFFVSPYSLVDGAKRRYGLGSAASDSIALKSSSGVIAMTTTASTATAYHDGSADALVTPITSATWSGTPAASFIGAYNAAGSAQGYMDVYVQSVAIYNTTLSAAQVLAVTTAMQTL